MASLYLHASAKPTQRRPEAADNNNLLQLPLPTLLQTPSGLALLELQGTINLPEASTGETAIGRLVFDGYDAANPDSMAWMKSVYLYVGKHQRLSGEVKKLPKAIAVIRKRGGGLKKGEARGDGMDGVAGEGKEELEVVEIVKWKILFSTRPEPVGTWEAGDSG